MEENKKETPAATEVESIKEQAIKEIEDIFKKYNFDLRDAISAFRWARWNVFKNGFPTNEATPSQIEKFKRIIQGNRNNEGIYTNSQSLNSKGVSTTPSSESQA